MAVNAALGNRCCTIAHGRTACDNDPRPETAGCLLINGAVNFFFCREDNRLTWCSDSINAAATIDHQHVASFIAKDSHTGFNRQCGRCTCCQIASGTQIAANIDTSDQTIGDSCKSGQSGGCCDFASNVTDRRCADGRSACRAKWTVCATSRAAAPSTAPACAAARTLADKCRSRRFDTTALRARAKP